MMIKITQGTIQKNINLKILLIIITTSQNSQGLDIIVLPLIIVVPAAFTRRACQNWRD